MNADEEYQTFMGDRYGQPGHNRRMLTYLAGLKDDRERLLVVHAWQLYDHSCNTERADAQARRQHLAIVLTLALSGAASAVSFGLASNRDTASSWISLGVGAVLISAAIIVGLKYRIKNWIARG